MKEEKHLPVIGVGPIIVIPQLLLTAVGIIASGLGCFTFGKVQILKYPFLILGVLMILGGIYLWYSAFFMVCIGAVLIANNLILLLIPVLCWIYMTILLIHTEEKWLKGMYGQEYEAYCKKVNRCIPWFPKG